MSSCPYTAQLECCIGSGDFIGGRGGGGAGRDWRPPPKCTLSHPLVYAWMIQILLISSYLELDYVHERHNEEAEEYIQLVYLTS